MAAPQATVSIKRTEEVLYLDERGSQPESPHQEFLSKAAGLQEQRIISDINLSLEES